MLKGQSISIIINGDNGPNVIHGKYDGRDWGLNVIVENQFHPFYEVYLSDLGLVHTRWRNSAQWGLITPSSYRWGYYAARQAATTIFSCFCARFRCKDVAKLICLEIGKHKRNHIWQNIK